ncbi:sugar ABC transporter ATP-binding protein [Herbaspirillum sp. alder98]|uniref:sugar ABC transporter ATP-binding protein n=1 Tax=Herbaspirillum sp. alder98 TaxID=2913096 RepID=UPI001CD84C7C|nr:sugar ABC transporter ATP-binding protein [Herbaspirillum sp. alder98]MCA1323048.1 sugar ABC transporter ATP-binding protein [Herbaspirillum sp. alder98]
MNASPSSRVAAGAPLCSLSHIDKSYGPVKALQDVSLDIGPGQCWGLVGHNGAGKSTLMNVLAGVLACDQGQVAIDGQPLPGYSTRGAYRHGVRCVFQELSLCLNLSVAENLCVFHPALKGFGWRRRATALVTQMLDDIFPGHGIAADRTAGELTITQRQMVEIACAFVVVDAPVRLLILDEPTSSLDAQTAARLTGYIRRRLQDGMSLVFISHMLGEIFDCCSHIAVMRDGKLVLQDLGSNLNRESLVQAMGHADQKQIQRQAEQAATPEDLTPLLEVSLGSDSPVRALQVGRGQVVGLSGLAGQGQTEMLVRLFEQHRARMKVAFVAGDRARDGNFPLWSILHNLSIRTLPALSRHGVVDRAQERELGAQWHERIAIRTPDLTHNILSLSGGNQQKVLFARALASDADLILMDDPMRGVDFGTKVDMYRLIRAEAARGRSFVWYTTENDELEYCDHTYVFYQRQVTLALARHELSEERIIAASFGNNKQAPSTPARPLEGARA